jgi:hypothetical protein
VLAEIGKPRSGSDFPPGAVLREELPVADLVGIGVVLFPPRLLARAEEGLARTSGFAFVAACWRTREWK